MSLFSFNTKAREIPGDAVLKSIAAAKAVDLGIYDHLGKAIPGIEQNMNLFFWSDGRWSSYQLLNHFLDLMGEADVWITTYGINENAMRQIANRKQAKHIRKLYFVFSDEVKRIKPAEIQIATKVATAYCMHPCHAKIIALRNPDYHVLIVSSMNMNRNNKLEAGTISTDPAVVNQFINFLNDKICSSAKSN